MLRHALFILLTAFLPLGDAFAGVDVNAATAKQLESLPGIGPTKAGDIIAYREANGPFAASRSRQGSGIGPATLANIGILVEFGDHRRLVSPRLQQARRLHRCPRRAAAPASASTLQTRRLSTPFQGSAPARPRVLVTETRADPFVLQRPRAGDRNRKGHSCLLADSCSVESP